MFIKFIMATFFCMMLHAGDDRISGEYVFVSAKKNQHSHHVLHFEAKEKTAPFARLHIETDHLRFDLVEGKSYKISAEPIRNSKLEKNRSTELGQLMIYVPQRQGPTPIWILSVKNEGVLKGAKLLDMHNPGSDYQLF